MLGSSKSNIYVSIGRAIGRGRSNGKDEHEHIWIIAVEPQQLHIPGTKHPEPTLLYATPQSNAYAIHNAGAGSESMVLLGNILLAEKTKGTPDDIEASLKEKLTTDSAELPSEDVSESESDRWIRKGLHILQAEDILEKFDVGEFMTFAHAYLARREEVDAPALIAYPKLDKDHHKKSRMNSLWLSSPTESKITSV